VADNSTVSVCGLAISKASKAFDSVDHFALLHSLMGGNLPKNFIGELLEMVIEKFCLCSMG